MVLFSSIYHSAPFTYYSFYYSAILSHHQFICLLQELRRNRVIQLPGDIHGTRTFVLYIIGCSQIGVYFRTISDPIILELSNKQQDLTSLFPVMDVPLTCGRSIRCGTLTLPMEQGIIDRIVVVHGRRRIIFICV